MTPEVTSFTLEWLSPIRTFCVRPRRKLVSHSSALSLIPMLNAAWMINSRGVLSKAFLKSNDMISKGCPAGAALVMKESSTKRLVTVDHWATKPCWEGWSNLLMFR